MKNLERVIKERLLELGLSQKKLCEELKIQPPALQKIFRENSTSIDTLERLATALKLSVSDFFEEKRILEEPRIGYITIAQEEYIELLRTANRNLKDELSEKTVQTERLKNI